VLQKAQRRNLGGFGGGGLTGVVPWGEGGKLDMRPEMGRRRALQDGKLGLPRYSQKMRGKTIWSNSFNDRSKRRGLGGPGLTRNQG